MPFSNSYARLPERFHAKLAPTPVAAPRLIKWNDALAAELGISMLDVEVLAGNRLAEGSEPLAMAYAGHQFGNFVPQLGDGRAILLGEVVDTKGVLRDIQLKGSGPTPFSRRGDGRAALGPVLREYIVAEAMAALGIPTTRALAAVATGETVWREEPLPGAVLTRVASSHIRVGTFQYFAARGDEEGLRLLSDYVIARHYPEAAGPREMLDRVIASQARLIARWMCVGFIHGVMNTDNMQVAGETIDYGPCAFMDTYHPEKKFSSIDEMGRYAYANQPRIAHWNLVRLAETLLPLIGEAEAQASVDTFPALYQEALGAGFRAKLGLKDEQPDDMTMVQELLDAMAANEADFTLTFRRLYENALPDAFDAWRAKWQTRLKDADRETMRRASPAFIPRNHRVEFALAAAQQGDFSLFEELVAVLARPYDDQPEFAKYAEPPGPGEIVQRTFCGT
jgi:uncharacterized protein YdiU (UPF0061 family)